MNKNKILHYDFLKKLLYLSYIHEICLFGSRARSDYSENSDIDLAILCSSATQFGWRHIIDIVQEADTLLKISNVMQKI